MQAKEARQLSSENASNNRVYYILQIEIEKAAKQGFYKAHHVFSDETLSSINKTINLLKQDGFEVELYYSMNEFYICVSW
jgi:predicted adenine nucleotide alpha hydrolase (AANH) superfamily ATPase